MNNNYSEMRSFFEQLYERYNNRKYINTDPIRFPHEIEGNQEFISFTSAVFAYGNMKAIQGFLFKYFENIGTDPYMLKTEEVDSIYYRFQNKKDVVSYSLAMKRLYNDYGSINNLFKKAQVTDINSAYKGIKLIREYFDNITSGVNFLLPIPGKSASKRLYMFLRWMIRKDEVDLGLWDCFDKSSLYMPVDTHIMRMGINYGIINEGINGKKGVDKITAFFKELNPNDPAKYDFALTRLGIVSSCKYSKTVVCNSCIYDKCCLFN